jgi:hypothetical protein
MRYVSSPAPSPLERTNAVQLSAANATNVDTGFALLLAASWPPPAVAASADARSSMRRLSDLMSSVSR